MVRYSPPLHGSPGFFVPAGAAFFWSAAGSASLRSTVGGVALDGALAAGFFAQATHSRRIDRLRTFTPPSYRMLPANGHGVQVEAARRQVWPTSFRRHFRWWARRLGRPPQVIG